MKSTWTQFIQYLSPLPHNVLLQLVGVVTVPTFLPCGRQDDREASERNSRTNALPYRQSILFPIHSIPIPITNNVLLQLVGVVTVSTFDAFVADKAIERRRSKIPDTPKWALH